MKPNSTQKVVSLEDVFLIEKGGCLASCVSFTKSTVSIHTKCFQLRMKLPLVGMHLFLFE